MRPLRDRVPLRRRRIIRPAIDEDEASELAVCGGPATQEENGK